MVYSSIEPCAHIIVCWNISQSASAYSSLAGVLAGFLVTAIVLSLSNPPKREEVKDISHPLCLVYQVLDTKGSHRQYEHPIKKGLVTVPGHFGDDMPPGTLASVFRQAKLKRQ